MNLTWSKISEDTFSHDVAHILVLCRTDSYQRLFNTFQKESNGQPRVTKNSKIILMFQILEYVSVNRGDKSYMLIILTVLGGGGVKTM